MKTLTILIVFAVSAFAESSVRSFTPEELVNLALSDNPELRWTSLRERIFAEPFSTLTPSWLDSTSQNSSSRWQGKSD